MTAPGAAGYAGVGWFLEIAAHIERYPHRVQIERVLDCGAEPGVALGLSGPGLKSCVLLARVQLGKTSPRLRLTMVWIYLNRQARSLICNSAMMLRLTAMLGLINIPGITPTNDFIIKNPTIKNASMGF